MYNTIFSDEFYQKTKSEQLAILDVRDAIDFEQGHIETAVGIPLMDLTNRVSELDHQKDYYVVCYSGNRSALACAFLQDQGFHVTNVAGGMSTWKGQLV